MISKEELLSIPQMARDIEAEDERIMTMKSRLYSPKGLDTSEKVQSSGGNQTALADVVIDLEQKLDLKKMALERLQDEVVEMVYHELDLEDVERIIFLLRYTERCLGWRDIAAMIHYGESTVYRKHDEVLRRIYPEK